MIYDIRLHVYRNMVHIIVILILRILVFSRLPFGRIETLAHVLLQATVRRLVFAIRNDINFIGLTSRLAFQSLGFKSQASIRPRQHPRSMPRRWYNLPTGWIKTIWRSPPPLELLPVWVETRSQSFEVAAGFCSTLPDTWVYRPKPGTRCLLGYDAWCYQELLKT